MLCLAEWCGATFGNAIKGTRIDVRAELSNKHVGYLYWKDNIFNAKESVFEFRRQCANLFRTNQEDTMIPFAFLRVKFEGTTISLYANTPSRVTKEAACQFAKLTTRKRPVVYLCWEEEAYQQACKTMSFAFERFKYVDKKDCSILECVCSKNTQVTVIPTTPSGVSMMNFFRTDTLVLHMQDLIVNDKMFQFFNLHLKVLKLRGGRYLEDWDYYLPFLNCLEELDIDDSKQASDFCLASTILKRLRLSNFKLSEVPFVVRHMASLVALDLSNNNLQSLPEWIYELYNLETLILRNNPKLSGVLDVRRFPKLVTLDVSSCNLQVQRLKQKVQES